MNILENEMLQRVKKELQYAYENVPLFQNIFDNAKFNPKRISGYADFLNIPITEKKDYRDNYPFGVLAKGFKLNDKHLYKYPSSGTTGERLMTVELGFIYMQRALDALQVNRRIYDAYTAYPRRHIRIAAPFCSDVECANPNTTMEDRCLSDGTQILSVYHDLLTTPDKINEQSIEEIFQYQPNMYFVDPNHMAYLIRFMKRKGYQKKLPDAPILTTYSQCLNVSKRQISEHFGSDAVVGEVLALSELGFIAAECPCGNMHLNEKSFFLEVLAEGRAAVPGEFGEVYVTTLHNGCIPHIRYRTGDIVKVMEGICPCGNRSTMIQVEGRLRNFMFRNNKEIICSPRELDEWIGSPDWLELYKLYQYNDQDFTFYFISNKHYTEQKEKALITKLQKKLGGNAKLSIENVQYLPTERSGKFIACKSKIGEKLYEEGFRV